MFLIVGLGNPGKFYKNHRHNIGFKIIDNIRDAYNFPDFSKKFKSEFSKTELNKNILFLLKPSKNKRLKRNKFSQKLKKLNLKRVLNTKLKIKSMQYLI